MSQSHATGPGLRQAGRGSGACQACRASARHRLLPALLPPLTIIGLLLTAGALLLTAALLVVPPLPATSARVALATAPVPTTDATSTTLARIASVALPRPPAVVDLARLIYLPGAGGSPRALLGPVLLVVKAGALTVQLDGAAQLLQPEQTRLVAAGDLVLPPGDGLLLPRGTAAALHNGGTGPAVVLSAGVFLSGGGASRFGRVGLASWNEAWSPGALVQPLAGGGMGTTTATAATTATLMLQRLSLPPGAHLPLSAPGPVDLAVETGVLTLEGRGGLVWQQPPQGQDQAIEALQTAALLPGDAALLQDAATVTLRNDGRGPLVVLALSVELDHHEASTPRAATQASSPQFVLHVGASEQPPQNDRDLREYLSEMTALRSRRRLITPTAIDPSAAPLDPSAHVGYFTIGATPLARDGLPARS